MGILFTEIGLKITLLYYAIAAAIILVLFTAYMFVSVKHNDHYEKVEDSESETEESEYRVACEF